ncbi:MAG: proprotein convertase P-domain-containing protein [Deltaproteobacteria bacterium]|nr:proprotein convertase P-domain-containing protein [Deltaproteobacteria bacterium]
MRKRILLSLFVVAALLAAPLQVAFAQDAKPAEPIRLADKISPTDAPGSSPALGGSCPNGGPVLLNQPPNQTNGIFSDVNCASCTATGTQVVADNFTLAADATVAQIVMWGGYFPGNMIPDPVDPVTVIFHDDAGGTPGAAITTQGGIAPASSTTGVTLFGVSELQYVIDITPVALTAGTYWVEIFTNSPNADSFFWEVGDPDATNGIVGAVFSTTAPGTGWAATGPPPNDFAITMCGAGGPILSITDTTVTDGCLTEPTNENGVFEPGEIITVDVEVSAANGGFTGISGTLSTATPGVTILSGFSSYPDLGDGESATADTPYMVYLDETIACFSQVDLDVTITSNEGAPLVTMVSETVGAMLVPNVPVAITDNDPAGSSSTLDVADDVVISDLNVRVDVAHSWVGDLILTLRSPANTEVVLLDQPGVPASMFGCADNNMNVTFDDGAGGDLENLCAGSDPWFVGSADAVGALSDFNGESTAGTWTLLVSDNAAGDTGTITDWELITDPVIGGVCVVCTAGLPGGGQPVVEVPTMGTVGFITLLLALALAGVFLMRRRSNA